MFELIKVNFRKAYKYTRSKSYIMDDNMVRIESYYIIFYTFFKYSVKYVFIFYFLCDEILILQAFNVKILNDYTRNYPNTTCLYIKK